MRESIFKIKCDHASVGSFEINESNHDAVSTVQKKLQKILAVSGC